MAVMAVMAGLLGAFALFEEGHGPTFGHFTSDRPKLNDTGASVSHTQPSSSLAKGQALIFSRFCLDVHVF